MTAHNNNRSSGTGASAGSGKYAGAANKMNKKKKKTGNVFFSGLKNFGIVFILCLVIFGLLASLAVSFVTSAVDDIFEEKNQLEEILKKDSEEVAVSNDDTPLPEGESFTVFIAVTDFDPDHYNYYPHGADLAALRLRAGDRDLGILSAGYKTVSTKLNVIVRFDKERREYTVTPVSSHTRIFTPSGYMQIGDLYHTYGPQYLIDKIKAITGIGIDYYMIFDAREASDIISVLGPFNVELAKDIYSDGAAFGTIDKSYGDVTTVIPPDTIPAEPKKTEKDKKDKDKKNDTDETADDVDTTVEITETTEDITTESEKPDDGKEPRETYHKVVSSGAVTVNKDNIRALLMFDDYESSGAEERMQLEFELVRGALLRLASMSDEDRMKFYDIAMKETPIEDCSVTFVAEKTEDDEKDAEGEDDKDGDEDDKDEKKKDVEPAGYGTFTDRRINTDISRKSAQLKAELIEAAMRFPVKYLEFEGRYVNGYFAADMTGNASRFQDYKLFPDPEKIVTVVS